ncbi:hypothetical protein BU26DRAFT_566044 [Trematosphaeria pertusa]|uniref:Uncharacterized protein n=1 Tax=Trematosphaeria pertusa TaxID=390896 RepID=A0A6A6IC21_9PLEO|nr:uncharacterized protein BU26DRAFT_566044 [Trematosphaeria pertusa]KAF2247043.1 hypothetical protein BU26DRAFT_566044 [Trematosphaeria pertusa]
MLVAMFASYLALLICLPVASISISEQTPSTGYGVAENSITFSYLGDTNSGGMITKKRLENIQEKRDPDVECGRPHRGGYHCNWLHDTKAKSGNKGTVSYVVRAAEYIIDLRTLCLSCGEADFSTEQARQSCVDAFTKLSLRAIPSKEFKM